jgi:hypothetical protein
MKDPQEGVRVAALQWLIDHMQGIDPDPVRGDRDLAAFFLGAYVGAEVLAAARDDSAAVRAKALAALRFFPTTIDDAVPTLIRALADSDSGCREAAAHSLDSFGPAHRHGLGPEEAWTAAVNHQQAETRQVALRLLGSPPPERAAFVVRLARAAMQENAAEVRKAALELLRRTDRDRASVAVPSVAAALDDEDAKVRREAISTLEWFGPDAVQAVEKLAKVMVEDSDEDVSHAAFRAALRIDPEYGTIFPFLARYEGGSTREVIIRLLSTLGEAGRTLRRRLREHWARRAEGQDDRHPSASAVDSSAPTPAVHEDGPGNDGRLWWNNKPHHIPPKPFRLLNYMWDKDSAKTVKVMEYVWEEDDDVTDAAVKSVIHKLNEILGKAGVPWKLSMRSRGEDISKIPQ